MGQIYTANKIGLADASCGLNHFHLLQQWHWISPVSVQCPCSCKIWLLLCMESFSSFTYLQWLRAALPPCRIVLLRQKHRRALYAQKCCRWAWEGCRSHWALEGCRDGRVLNLTVCKLCWGSGQLKWTRAVFKECEPPSPYGLQKLGAYWRSCGHW